MIVNRSRQQSETFVMFAIHKILFLVCALALIYEYYTNVPSTIIRIKEPRFTMLGPYNTTRNKVTDVSNQLIDINNFEFKINPQPCKDYVSGLLLMMIISSSPVNHEKRMVIRNTWGKNLDSTKVVFLIGESENSSVSSSIQDESTKYGDLVQGSFIDAYRNMTYKHVMGLKWVAHHCPVAKYVLKTDDDVLVNSHELRHFLTRELSPWGTRNLIICPILAHTSVLRENSKWKVTTEEYAPEFYPTYCAGWAILYSQDVVHSLLKEAQATPYFWIDDVHITGVIAEKIGIPRTSISSMILPANKVKVLKMFGTKFVPPFVLGPADLPTDKIIDIWKAIPE